MTRLRKAIRLTVDMIERHRADIVESAASWRDGRPDEATIQDPDVLQDLSEIDAVLAEAREALSESVA